MAEEHVVISSLIVECLPQDTDATAAMLAGLAGVEVHGQDEGQVVITIEKESLTLSHDLANSIAQMDGVTNVNLVYANFEDDEELQTLFENQAH